MYISHQLSYCTQTESYQRLRKTTFCFKGKKYYKEIPVCPLGMPHRHRGHWYLRTLVWLHISHWGYGESSSCIHLASSTLIVPGEISCRFTPGSLHSAIFVDPEEKQQWKEKAREGGLVTIQSFTGSHNENGEVWILNCFFTKLTDSLLLLYPMLPLREVLHA